MKNQENHGVKELYRLVFKRCMQAQSTIVASGENKQSNWRALSAVTGVIYVHITQL